MILFNPTDSTVKVLFKGNEYSIPARENSDDLSDDLAKFWLGVHPFLTAPSAAAPVVSTPEPEAPEVAPEPEVNTPSPEPTLG